MAIAQSGQAGGIQTGVSALRTTIALPPAPAALVALTDRVLED
jgi:hypothetical protein